MSDEPQFQIEAHPAISSIDAAQWEACANPDPATFNPFVSHAFLASLEEAGTVGARSGWGPCHVTVRRHAGTDIAACAPCYLKTNSQGEYVFDHAWADAFERAGGAYYPKLQCAVPFTPVPGRRLLVAAEADREVMEKVLAAALVGVARQVQCSSVHITFCDEPLWARLGAGDQYLQRTDQQFHWHNRGYASFEDFLAGLSSRKRKAIRKERREAVSDGVDIIHLAGAEITEAHWDAFFQFYIDTGSRKWGRPYLNRRFFSLIGAAMPERCLLVLARQNGSWIAGALNLIGGDCLYGRYWGSTAHKANLHFEVCYYQAIDYAIAQRLARVEAGAQGEHKLARGYLPSTTYSLHWIADPHLKRAVARYLVAERAEVAAVSHVLTEHGPYRQDRADQD